MEEVEGARSTDGLLKSVRSEIVCHRPFIRKPPESLMEYQPAGSQHYNSCRWVAQQLQYMFLECASNLRRPTYLGKGLPFIHRAVIHLQHLQQKQHESAALVDPDRLPGSLVTYLARARGGEMSTLFMGAVGVKM